MDRQTAQSDTAWKRDKAELNTQESAKAVFKPYISEESIGSFSIVLSFLSIEGNYTNYWN